MSDRLTYPNKTNNPSDPETVNMFFATEANEIKTKFNTHADDIEALQNAIQNSSNPFYGFFTSLALLQAAHPVGEANAYAVIDPGVGQTVQIAVWDTGDSEWKITGATNDKVFVTSYANLPQPGVENVWYITTNNSNAYLWFNSQYNLINKPVNLDLIYIEGSAFRYIPILGNDGSSFQAGDLATDGWISQNEYGKILQYVSGDATLFASWEIIESI